MKKIVPLINFPLFVFLIVLFQSCSKEEIRNEQNENDDKVLEIVSSKYGVSKITNDVSISSDFISHKYNNDLQFLSSLDFKHVIKYDFNKSDLKIYAIPFSKNKNKFYIVNGITNKNNLEIMKDILIEIEMDKNGNGYIDILNEENEIIDYIDLKNGKTSLSYSEIKKANSSKSTMDFTWCQRTEGEDTSDCYKRETDEFCDDFISCAVLATNPQVHILILAMCVC